MILWARKFGLIFGLALFIFACEESGEIGLELDPERGGFSARYIEIPLRTSVIQTDSVATKNLTQVLATRLKDPDFGDIYTEGYSQLFLDNANISIPGVDSAFYDSLMLDLQFSYKYGPDDGTMQSILIHELSDTIPSARRYAFNTTPYFPDPIGQVDLDLSVYDTIQFDTTITIRISDEVGQRLFDRAQVEQDINESNDSLRKFFNGLAFVADAMNTNSIGMVLFSNNTQLRMHYHTLADTTLYSFKFFNGRTSPVTANYYHHMSLDKSGTVLDGLTEPYTEFKPGNGFHYTHAGFGILSRISLTPVFNFVDTVGPVVVNRADIEIGTEEYTGFFQPPRATSFDILNEDNFFISTPVGPKGIHTGLSKSEFIEAPFMQDLNATSGHYSGEASWFIGELIKGTNTDSVFSVFPADYGGNVNRFVGSDEGALLKLYYSSLQ
jgi:hypothetical protein